MVGTSVCTEESLDNLQNVCVRCLCMCVVHICVFCAFVCMMHVCLHLCVCLCLRLAEGEQILTGGVLNKQKSQDDIVSEFGDAACFTLALLGQIYW